MAVLLTVVADDDGFSIDFITLHECGQAILFNREWRHTIVSHQRESHHQQLTSIAGIGQRLRITHHRRVENNLSAYGFVVPEAFSLKFCSVFQDQFYIFHHLVFIL